MGRGRKEAMAPPWLPTLASLPPDICDTRLSPSPEPPQDAVLFPGVCCAGGIVRLETRAARFMSGDGCCCSELETGERRAGGLLCWLAGFTGSV